MHEVFASSATIAYYAPVLETSDGVLDATATLAMSTPHSSVSDDPVASKGRRDELRDISIAAIGQDTSMAAAHRLDGRAAVVKRIVAVTRPAAIDADDAEIDATHEHSSVA